MTIAVPVPATAADLLTAGHLQAARARFWEEWHAAVERDDGPAMADAALGLGGIWVHEHRGTLERARVLATQRRALAGLDPADPRACRLRVRLAAEQAYLDADGDALFAALDDARGHGDAVVVAEALSLTHHCLLGPHHADDRLVLADELLVVAPATGRDLDATMGLAWRTVDLVLGGDRRAARSRHELRSRLGAHPCAALAYLADALDVTATMRAGDLAGAEAQAERCLHHGLAVGDADAEGWFGAQLLAIRWMQGRAGELLDVVADLDHADSVPELNEAFAAAAAFVAAEAGRHDEARRALARFRRGALGDLPPSSAWLVTVAAVAETAAAVGDQAVAAEAYALLQPFADRPVMASLGVACFGSAQRPLGLAAAAMGDLDRAVAHLEQAVTADVALGHGPAYAIALGALADVLDRRGAAGDAERAATHRREALAEAGRYGMDGWIARWAGAGRAGGVDTAPCEDAVCRREGRSWVVQLGERRALVRPSVGMDYLAVLTAHPGTEIAAVELASGHALAARRAPAEPLVDDTAKRRYRRRIEELQAAIDEAEDRFDSERASLARLELDALMDELARAAGWHGRARQFTDDGERARVSVRKALTRALGAIAEADAEIAARLGARLTTGARCLFAAPAPLDALAG